MTDRIMSQPVEGNRSARSPPGEDGARRGGLRVIVPALPRISNHTDFDPLRLHPQVDFRYVGPGQPIPAADLIILPGSKIVRADLARLRAQGWEEALFRHLRYRGKLIGICGGFQMAGQAIEDPLGLEGEPGEARGLGLLALTTTLSVPRARFPRKVRSSGPTCTDCSSPLPPAMRSCAGPACTKRKARTTGRSGKPISTASPTPRKRTSTSTPSSACSASSAWAPPIGRRPELRSSGRMQISESRSTDHLEPKAVQTLNSERLVMGVAASKDRALRPLLGRPAKPSQADLGFPLVRAVLVT